MPCCPGSAAAPDEKDLHATQPTRPVQRQDVQISGLAAHVLALLNVPQGGDLVPNPGRLLVFPAFRRLFHTLHQPVDD